MLQRYDALTVPQYSYFFQTIGSSHCLKNKQAYIDKFNFFRRTVDFTWREDQKHIIDSVCEGKNKYSVINGIFGCGKTTMLFGMLITFILNKVYMPSECMFISFNVCIKNEIIRKLKPYGFRGKIRVSTFDSIVYFICKRLGYPHMNLPNFDGKRRFCYEKCLDNEAPPESDQPKIIFIDEVQDLEKNCFFFFQYFFPNSKIVFAGDVFQSIQKEPRESLLWSLLHNMEDDIGKYYMKITPRVPRNILKNLQDTLTDYYPEFTHEIAEWRSENRTSEATVTWNRTYSYAQIYDLAKEKIEKYGESNTMILTFSSAITVRGSLGDIARLRMELVGNYDVNKDHKKFDDTKLFLSTANSSKGLERDHVVVFLTFPLELAFSNFSNDIVVNLITVAITRAKKSVDFFVPAYKDKFSDVLKYFVGCPAPNKERIRAGKSQRDYTFQDYMDMTRCVTELIRQSIIIYDTRTEIKQNIKLYETSKCFEGEINFKRPIMLCEEERAMVGVVIENLVTSSWSGKWPYINGIENLRNHPMYVHIFNRIEIAYNRYSQYCKKSAGSMTNENQFQGIYLYSQLHLAMYNKLFISFPKEAMDRLEKYWFHLKNKVMEFKPDCDKLDIQSNLQMPWVTGIADAIFTKKGAHGEEVNVWEIKASVDLDWKDNALTQAFLYSLMTGKSSTRITLINPFRNEKASYRFNSKKIMSLRNQVYKDVLVWNLNCYLAKRYNSRNSSVLTVEDKYFAYLNYSEVVCPVCLEKKKCCTLNPCEHEVCRDCSTKLSSCPLCREKITKLCNPTPIQLTVVEMLSPTKCFVRVNKFFKTALPTTMNRLQKLSKESEEEYSDDWIEECKKDVWLAGDEKEGCNKISDLIDTSIDFKQHYKYEYNSELKYGLDFDDGLVKCMCCISVMSDKYKFI